MNNRKPLTYKIPIYKIQLVKEAEVITVTFSNSKDVVNHMADLASSDREQMVCIYLDTKNRVIGQQTVAIGSLNCSFIKPQDIFKTALLCNAANLILAHNHPSGEPAPSKDDNSITKRLAEAGELLGITLLDHVIVCPNGCYYSFSDENPDLLKGGKT